MVTVDCIETDKQTSKQTNKQTRGPLGKGESRTGSKYTSMLYLLQHAACFLYLTLDDYTLKIITSLKFIVFNL